MGLGAEQPNGALQLADFTRLLLLYRGMDEDEEYMFRSPDSLWQARFSNSWSTAAPMELVSPSSGLVTQSLLLGEENGAVNYVFSPDSSVLVVSLQDGTILLVNLHRLQVTAELILVHHGPNGASASSLPMGTLPDLRSGADGGATSGSGG